MKIFQYDLDGNFINSFDTILEALNSLKIKKISVKNNARNKMKKILERGYGKVLDFQWRKDYFEKIEKYERKAPLRYVPVFQYDLDGNFIKKWPSSASAARTLSDGKRRSLREVDIIGHTEYNSQWRRKYYDKIEDLSFKKEHIMAHKKPKSFYKYDLDGNFICSYDSRKELLEEYPDIDMIYECINERQKSFRGFMWKDKYFEKIEPYSYSSNRSKSVVYVYTNIITNEKYIGQTNYGVTSRAGKNGKGYKKCPKFYAAIQKYGWENFKREIVQKNLSNKEADILEQKLIEKYDSINNGYNMTIGGQLSYKRI